MRAPENEATGTSGESEVLAEFQHLGWAALLDDRHDTGTDLYLRPRDARRFELGAVMGAQVKTGPSYFRSVERDAGGGIHGWWFAQPNWDHFNYWLRHALPHIIVLRNQEDGRSYWQHITHENVIGTGKGAKILVPADQVVNEAQNLALTNVALTQLPRPVLDGSIWSGAATLSPPERIRHALIAPRLVAPHPNLAPPRVLGDEALAMQILLRDEIERVLIPSGIPSGTSEKTWQGLSLDEARSSGEWAWRATAALHSWLYESEAAELLALASQTSDPTERAAAVSLICAYLFDQNDPDSVAEVVADALQKYDDYSPVDHAWLQVQGARAALEMGRREEAFDIAMATQQIYRQAPLDVTASAIAGACAGISFRAAGWMKGDVGNIIQRGDTPASWWRSQIMYHGLSDHLDQAFRAWHAGRDGAVDGSDDAGRSLRAAALLASCTGDHEGWRHATNSLGQHILVSAGQRGAVSSTAHALDLLRLSGDSRSVERATLHLVGNGPVAAVRAAAESVNLAQSTRTSAIADIALLRSAGDVLRQEQADEVCSWLLDGLTDPRQYIERVRPTFIVDYQFIDLLKALVWCVGPDSLQRLTEYLSAMPPITDDGLAQHFAPLVRAIPADAWSDADRERAADRTDGDAAYLREAFLRVAASKHAASRETIHERARSGDLLIFDAIEDVTQLPIDGVEALMQQLESRLETLMEEAEKGTYRFGMDLGHAMTMLNVWHPSVARWDPVLRLLKAPGVQARQLEGTLRVLAGRGSDVTAPVKDSLRLLAERLRGRQPPAHRFFFEDQLDIRSCAAEAVAALSNAGAREELVREILAGDANHRAAGARIIERFGDPAEQEMLLLLSGDMDADVRDAALAGLANLCVLGRGAAATHTVLSRAITGGGRSSGVAIVSRLLRTPRAAEADNLLREAQDHPAGNVRKAARQAIAEAS